MGDRDLAPVVLTPNELEAWTLADRGMSERGIALALDISRSAVRSRLENARRKITRSRRENAA